VLGILAACLLAVVFVPLLLIAGAAATNSSAPTFALIVIGAVLLIPLSLVVGGFLAAQSATYWTLAFRRLDLDPQPLAPPPPPLEPQPS